MENKSSSETGIEEKSSTPSGTITGIWKKPVLFNNKKRSRNYAFDVEMEFSSQKSESHLSQASGTSSQRSIETLSQDTSHNSKNLQLFKNQRRLVKDAFDVDFEESKQISIPGDTSEINLTEIRKINPFYNKKKSIDNAFEVDFHESKQILTPEDTNEGNLSKIRNQNPFQNKKQTRYNAFDVDFEESKQVSTPEDTNEGNLSKIRNQNPFQNKKQTKYNAFEIDFEESRQLSIPEDTSEVNLTKIGKPKPFQNKKQTKYNAFEIDFDKSTTGPITPNTPDSNKFTPFRTSGKNLSEKAFDVNFDKSTDTSVVRSITVAQVENSFKGKSIDASDMILIPPNKSIEENHSRLDVSSFNDENLNNWMSDHSEDEIKRNESLEESTAEKNLSVSPPMKTSEFNSTSDEDLQKRFRLKLSAIIDEACKGKMEKSYFALPKNKSDRSKKRSGDNERKLNQKKTKLAKPAPFVNKRLYNYLVKKMEPEYGIDSVLEAEDIVKSICEVVKIVSRRKNYQKKLVHDLKVEMAKHGIIETTNDFYIFVRSFLPYDFREKVIPCLQPGTNIVFPPKDSKSPFEKILNN